MLPSPDRAFLYTYLAHTVQTGYSFRQALSAYMNDVKMNKKHTKGLKTALFLCTKKTTITSALYEASVIPETEWRIMLPFGKNNHILAEIFQEFSAQLRRERIIQKKIKALMIYPCILLIELALMFVILIFWLSPNLVSFSSSLQSATPPLIAFLYKTNRFAIHIINTKTLFIFCALVIGFILILRQAKHRAYHSIELIVARLYKINGIYRTIMSVKIIHLLGLLMERLPKPALNKALRITRDATKSQRYRSFLLSFAKHIESGGSIASFAKSKKNTKFFPLLVWRFLILGERSKTLQEKLKTLSTILVEELDIDIRHSISALEPLFIVFIAGIVGALAFFLQQTITAMESTALLP